jgi:acyl-CoA thioester hydrolase
MHTTPFEVRIFDVDVFGELRPNVLLRWLWQTASDATSAAGYDVEWYERQGTLWIIRRTQLELLAPAHFRDAVTVRTWVIDVRRVRSQRAYEVRRPGDDTLLARAVTDWVYVDLARGSLAQPPAELQRALMPEGVGSRPRDPSLAAPPPAHAARGVRRVELADLDSVAHVNNSQYAVFVEQAVWDALAAHGWTINPTAANERPRLAAHDLEYFDAAVYDDQLGTAVWVSDADADGFTTECELTRNRGRSLHARSVWRWSADVPQGLRTAVERLLSPR